MQLLFLQIFEESSKLQNIRLERQQALQKRHLRELKEFAEAYSSNDKLSQLPPPLLLLLSERETELGAWLGWV